MVKYKQQVADMLEFHKELFDRFKKIHDNYMTNPKLQEQFNEVGMEVMPIIRRYENNLCSKSESGKYGTFSSTLADKFQAELRKHFPKLDSIGLKN
jgi:Zn-dependent M32 family carboxypeptidase